MENFLSVNDLYQQSDSLEELVLDGMKDVQKIIDIENLGVNCYLVQCRNKIRVLSGIWDLPWSLLKDTDYSQIFAEGYVLPGLAKEFEKKFVTVFTNAYNYVSNLDEKGNCKIGQQ